MVGRAGHDDEVSRAVKDAGEVQSVGDRMVLGSGV